MTAQQQETLTATEQWVKSLHGNDTGGHDWHHIERVRNVAVAIAKEEGVNLFLVGLMAILHDAADRKAIGHGNEQKMLGEIRSWLKTQKLSPKDIEEIMYVIEKQSFSKSGLGGYKLTSKAGQCVQDADRLDGFGVIGIARCFAYGGKRGRPLYDPDVDFREHVDAKNYKDCPSSLHHFTEKLLHLKDQMNTRTGKRLAEQRHEITQAFFDTFLEEWKGNR